MTVKIAAHTYCNQTERYCLHPNLTNNTHISCRDVIQYDDQNYTCSCSSTSCSITENCNKIYEFDEQCEKFYNSMGNDVMIPFAVVIFLGLLFCCFRAARRPHYRRGRYGEQVAHNFFGQRIHNQVRRRPQRKTVLRLTTYTIDDIELVDYNADEISENRECVICLDKLKEKGEEKEEEEEKEKEEIKKERQIAKLKCNHYFHEKCISSWFDQKPDCPICRGTVVIDEETVEITI
jgi:hypothetical protein